MPWVQKINEWFNGRMVLPFDDEDENITADATLTASGTAHTKGSWTQIIASAPFDIGMLWITADDNHAASTNTSMLLDIGIGAASSEVVLLPDILAGHSTLSASQGFMVPIFIPQGTRISGRIQAAITSDTLRS